MSFPKLFVVCVILITATTVFADKAFESRIELWSKAAFSINCGENITGEYGEFSSPNYPNEYPNNADCVWIITGPFGDSSLFQIEFDTFVTENGFDFLELRAGPAEDSPLIRTMTGNVPNPAPIYVESRYIRAWFHSDASSIFSGFRAHFQLVSTVSTVSTEEPTTVTDPQTVPTTTTPPTPGCSQTFTDTWGTFNSPEFPFYYPYNTDCEWIFLAPQGSLVHITLAQQLSLERDPECGYDYIEFRDGPNSDSPIITKICGYHEVPLPITSTSNTLYARFHSDDEFNAQGFVGIYQQRQVHKLELEERKEHN